MGRHLSGLRLAPLGTHWWSRPDLIRAKLGDWEPVAEIAYSRGESVDAIMQILLANRRTGAYARRTAQGAVRTIDGKEAAMALEQMERRQDAAYDLDLGSDLEESEGAETQGQNGEEIALETAGERAERESRERLELAALVKAWRGDLHLLRAAQMLGMPPRTLEGIEQGRGFRYARLLVLAMAAFGADVSSRP